MKIKINTEKCIGCGMCQSICPEVFELNEKGKSEVKEGVENKKNEECIKEAIDACPVKAIEKIEE